MKTISLLIILTGLNFTGFAANLNDRSQPNFLLKDNAGGNCFDGSTKIINIGIGAGSGGYYNGITGGNYSSSPAFSASYEQPWKQKLGPGYLGIGGYLGFQTAHYHYNYNHYGNGVYYYDNRWTYSMIAARAAYHWDPINKEKFELYGGLVLGVRIQTYRYTSNDTDPNYNYQSKSSSVYPAFSLFIGGRYYFTKSIGAFVELGYGISYATAGVSFKL